MNNTTLRHPYFMAGLALGILNIIPILYEFTAIGEIYNWRMLIVFELLFALNLSIILKALESVSSLFSVTSFIDGHRSNFSTCSGSQIS